MADIVKAAEIEMWVLVMVILYLTAHITFWTGQASVEPVLSSCLRTAELCGKRGM